MGELSLSEIKPASAVEPEVRTAYINAVAIVKTEGAVLGEIAKMKGSAQEKSAPAQEKIAEICAGEFAQVAERAEALKMARDARKGAIIAKAPELAREISANGAEYRKARKALIYACAGERVPETKKAIMARAVAQAEALRSA